MKPLITILILLLSLDSKATDIKLSTPILYIEENQPYAVFNLSSDNAWHNQKNHDAAWVFFKLQWPAGYKHINVAQTGHVVVSNFSNGNLGFEVPDDGSGLFIYPEASMRGKIEVTVKILLDPQSIEGVNTRNSQLMVHGIEMVKIPAGEFQLGDPDPAALRFGALYQPDKNGAFQSLVSIRSESQKLKVGTNGDLYYQAPEGYEGDQQGTIPAEYPKGVNSFYIMKYEPTEGQYVHFLNSLHENQLVARTIVEVENYSENGGTIMMASSDFETQFPNKPCLFMSWDDAMAYADWAGLRPMTEFEFTKAARGPGRPIAKEFPWGTNSNLLIQRLPNPDGVLTMVNGWDESNLEENNREYYGASYYWVMDLAGSMWERLITIGHENGRKYTGTHGDGTLSTEGNANVQTWPTGDEESGGIGFRGGGFYGYGRSYHTYNPFSPIAYRPYGGWHGAMRTNSYGTRFVRTSR